MSRNVKVCAELWVKAASRAVSVLRKPHAHAGMTRSHRIAERRIMSVITALAAAVLGCGPKTLIPPRIDLAQHEIIGVIEFKFSSKGELGFLATKKFIEAARRDQGLVRMIELESEAEILKKAGREYLNEAVFKTLGDEHNLKTIFTGELNVSGVRPNITITPGFGFLNFSAEVDATLTVRMTECATGASLWSGSASDTKTVGNISIFGGKDFAFEANDPEKAYGKLVNGLVEKITRDFHVSWERK